MTILDQPAIPDPKLASPDERVHVAVAPGLLDQEHVVDREEDDTDADYEARSRLVAAVLKIARQVD
nr:hypothetical protein [uncultured Rhodopila sp.]